MKSQLLKHYYIISAEQMKAISEAANRLQALVNQQYNAGKLSQGDYIKAINNLHSISRQQYHSLEFKQESNETNKSNISQ